MRPSRCTAAFALAALLGCGARGPTVLPSASDPAAQGAGAADYQEIRVENGGHRGIVWDLAFSRDGAHFYSAGDDKVIRVWDARRGALVRVLRIPIGPAIEGAIYALAVSPDERWVAAGGCHGCAGFWSEEDAHLLFVLDAATGRLAGIGEGHRDSIHSVAFAPDGRSLASGSADRSLRIWSVGGDGRLTPQDTLAAHAAAVLDVVWFPDGRRLASAGGDGSLFVWSPHPGGGRYPELALNGHRGPVLSVDVTPDGRGIVSGGSDGTIRHWDAQSGAPVAVLHQLGAMVLSVRVARDGRQLAYGSGGGALDETGVGVLPLVSGTTARFARSRDTTHAVAWSPAGDRLASSEGQYGGISLLRPSDLAAVRLAGSGAPITGVGFTARGVAWRHGRDAIAWSYALDTTTLAIEQDVDPASVGVGYPDPRIEGVALNEGGPGFVRVVGSVRFSSRVARSPLLAWSLFGGSTLALGSDVALHLVDFAADTRRDCSGHESLVNAVAPLAGGAIALTGSADQTLRFWDAATCRERLVFYRDGGGSWAAWTPEGTFTSAAGGEKFLGVHRNRGARAAPSFEPVSADRHRADLFATSMNPQ